MDKKQLNKAIKLLAGVKLLDDYYKIRHDEENNVYELVNDGVVLSNIEAVEVYIRDIRFYEDVYKNTR